MEEEGNGDVGEGVAESWHTVWGAEGVVEVW